MLCVCFSEVYCDPSRIRISRSYLVSTIEWAVRRRPPGTSVAVRRCGALSVCLSEIYYESRRSPYIEIFSLKTEWIGLPRQSSLTTVACYKSCSNTELSVRFSEKLLQVPQWKSGALRCAMKSYRRSVCYVKNEILISSLSGSFASRRFTTLLESVWVLCSAFVPYDCRFYFSTQHCHESVPNDFYVART